ncbi:MAG: hypothetical protein KME06_12535 [Kastovskya adunca ATA6-11-RM4]|nr:hypothetical protein [Kastovskya adunca ATA6-11-RM4]
MSTQKSFNVWDYKPWWCQPWSILLTGLVVIMGSWLLTQTLWLTILVALPILLWWFYFLWLWPRMMQRYSALAHSSPSSPDQTPVEDQPTPP